MVSKIRPSSGTDRVCTPVLAGTREKWECRFRLSRGGLKLAEAEQVRLVEIPENPVPAGVRLKKIGARGGVQLRTAAWSAEGDVRDAVVVIMQGRSEFIEEYFEVIGALLKRGFHVVAFDWRGQGGSDRILPDPYKGHVKRFDDYLEDLDAVMKKIVKPFGAKQKIALAHSMGGAVALRMALRDEAMFDRYVLCAPMIGLSTEKYTKGARFVASLLASIGFATRFIPEGDGYPFIPFENNSLTSDFRRFDRSDAILRAAPELSIGSPTLGWAATSFAAMAELQFDGTARAISNPVLILAGSQDRVTSTPMAEKFARGLKAGRFIEIEGARHEILQENEDVLACFWQEFDRFVDDA